MFYNVKFLNLDYFVKVVYIVDIIRDNEVFLCYEGWKGDEGVNSN